MAFMAPYQHLLVRILARLTIRHLIRYHLVCVIGCVVGCIVWLAAAELYMCGGTNSDASNKEDRRLLHNPLSEELCAGG